MIVVSKKGLVIVLNFFKKKETEKKVDVLVAPVNGTVLMIEDVPDPVFAQKLMGEGVAFSFSDSVICSPCQGRVKMIAETKHAIGIESDLGTEILIHIGLDTVSLEGKGFELNVKVGDKLSVGQPMISIDHQVMADNDINLITPMLITNGNEVNQIHILKNSGEVIKGETQLIQID